MNAHLFRHVPRPAPRRAVLALALAACASCIVTDPGPPPGEARRSESAAPPPTQPSVLYARDGTPVPVGAQPVGDGSVPHTPTVGAESRTFLLELYQETVDAKEALEREVRSLHADVSELRTSLAAREAELQAERGRAEGLEAERQRLSGENAELAARLVTAQIRRLEAERLLLESKVEWLRAQESARASSDMPLDESAPARSGTSAANQRLPDTASPMQPAPPPGTSQKRSAEPLPGGATQGGGSR